MKVLGVRKGSSWEVVKKKRWKRAAFVFALIPVFMLAGCADPSGRCFREASAVLDGGAQALKAAAWQSVSGVTAAGQNGRHLFAEEGTLWTHDMRYVEGSFEYVEDTETLWQWECGKLVKRRTCVFTESEAGVQITCYETGRAKALFSEFIRAEEWGQSAERVQRLYETFYDGLAPGEAYALRHVRKGEQEYIPQALADGLAEAMLAGTDASYLDALRVGSMLTAEEITALAGESDDILQDQAQWQDAAVIAADMDNDGIEDLLAQCYYGGSHGFADYVLFRGLADGKYAGSSRVEGVVQDFGVLRYAGENYLWHKDFDYGSKIDSGYTLSYYTDGSVAEVLELRFVPQAYDIRLAMCADTRYQKLAAGTMAAAVSYKDRTEAYEIFAGSAETEAGKDAEERFLCDVDNDGEQEAYTRLIWTPSNLGTVTGINFIGEEDAGLSLVREAAQSGAGDLIMLWFDRCGEETILNALCRTGLDDFEITGYFVTETEYKAVYHITAAASYEVRQRRSAPFREAYRTPYE